ncbi:MAG: hypothetical protein V2A62_04005 [Candidatus Woesearchaeota archaeon]
MKSKNDLALNQLVMELLFEKFQRYPGEISFKQYKEIPQEITLDELQYMAEDERKNPLLPFSSYPPRKIAAAAITIYGGSALYYVPFCHYFGVFLQPKIWKYGEWAIEFVGNVIGEMGYTPPPLDCAWMNKVALKISGHKYGYNYSLWKESYWSHTQYCDWAFIIPLFETELEERLKEKPI